jgi:molecular chaperone GrpE
MTVKSSTVFPKEITDLKEKLARALADYANLEKRIESQRQLFVTLATTAIIGQIIDALDDLHRAQAHLQDPGLKIAIDKLLSILKSEGLEEINPKDQEFNPKTMECVEVVNGKPDHVVAIKKVGYSLNGHCLRPAQVVVGRKPQPLRQKIKN